jgi:microcin C transport system substrate-binding protein
VPPRTDGANSLRGNLRKAQALLQEAGRSLRDGALRNAKGEALTIELLDSTEGRSASTLASWQRALQKLGIELKFRTVDFALYQERMDSFNFEMVGISFPGTHFPGADYLDFFGSKAADTQGTMNVSGIKSPAIDAILGRLTAADNKQEFLTACRTLDRVIAHGHYMVPAWTSTEARMAYNAWTLEHPKVIPPHPPEGVPYFAWPMTVWWARMPPKTSK